MAVIRNKGNYISNDRFGIKHRYTLKEVGDVAEGRYDGKIHRKLGKRISI